jgi:hypothetical protein
MTRAAQGSDPLVWGNKWSDEKSDGIAWSAFNNGRNPASPTTLFSNGVSL